MKNKLKKIIPNIEYTSVLKGYETLVERNEAFHHLNKEGQRMEVAWDLLALLMIGQVKGKSGLYWGDALNSVRIKYGGKSAEEFQQRLVNKPPKCLVCGIGGVMLCQIRMGNRLSPNTENLHNGSGEYPKVFTSREMKLIECYYERWNGDGEYYLPVSLRNYCEEYPYQKDKEDNQRLANICCNILINGKFNPKDLTDYLL